MPLGNSPPGETEIVCQLRETAATTPYDGEPAGHGPCLPRVSAIGKPEMLTHRRRLFGHLRAMELGRKIKTARDEAGLSQRALADVLDVTHGLIGQWESYGKKPGRDVLIKLSRVTGQPLSYFVDNVAHDPAILETRVPEEIELVKLFRRMSPKQRATHLALFRQSAVIRAVPKPQSQHPKGKIITS